MTIAIVSIASVLYIVLTSQKKPNSSKYYYAFWEKIHLTEVPNKFLVKTISAEDAEILASSLISVDVKSGKGVIRQKENCIIVETENVQKFESTIKSYLFS